MSETKFFCQQNLATDKVTVLDDPWNVRLDPAVLALPKEEYKRRWTSPETRHYLLYMVSGQNPDYVVSAGNQASVLYGFSADYDGVLTDDLIETIQKKPQSRYAPAYWCRSQSGKLHLFWFFERPISVAGNAHASALLKIIARKVKAAKWAVGYDPSSETVTQCMDIGYDWHVFKENVFIPSEEIVLWDFALFEAGARGVANDVVSIPMEIVAEEVKRRSWPHQPPVDFRVGARCVRFWDPSADNISGAQVTKDGVRVYTPHDNGFKSWKDLLGSEFCEQYTAKSMAPFIEDTYYCHTKDTYYRFFRTKPEHFEQRTEKMLRRELVLEGKLSDKVGKGEETSEVTRMLDSIVRRNSVEAVAPVIYRKTGKLGPGVVPGVASVLNTSLVVVRGMAPMIPVEASDLELFPNCPKKYKENPMAIAWDNPFAVRGFPHIHRLLTTVFMKNQSVYAQWRSQEFSLHDANGEPRSFLCDHQLVTFISWLHHFYKSAARQETNPGRGQALIIAGPAGRGKSFIAKELIGRLMGGAIDADKFYLEGQRFNSNIMHSPVHLIDDQLGSSTHRERQKFTDALKFTVARGGGRYEAKFGSSLETLPWPGRIIILANDDAQSMSVMPDLDMNTRDKFMMLKIGSAMFDWGTPVENNEWLDRELPHFARFLFYFDIPVELRDERFGVKAIQHQELAQASAENGLTNVLVQVLEACIESTTGGKDELDPTDREGWVVQGNAVKIFKWIMSVDPTFKTEVIDSRTVQQCLQVLYKSGAYNIVYDEAMRRWRIPYNLRKDENPT